METRKECWGGVIYMFDFEYLYAILYLDLCKVLDLFWSGDI